MREPDVDFIGRFLSSDYISLLSEKEASWDDEFWSKPQKTIAEELAVEYTRLFLGPKNHIPPYESLYNFKPGEAKQLWGSATVEVKKIIENSGLSLKKNYGGIPDHLGIELEFMQKVVKKEAELWKRPKAYSRLLKTLEVEKKFIDDHLEKWVPEFCRKVKKIASLDFYINFAELTAGFIFSEKKGVRKLISFLT
ncbi:MAG: molecular chaperone [Candidatus Aminicenantales bacterium]